MNVTHGGHRKQFLLRFRHGQVTLGEKTLVMGALNVTPDSFSDGGIYLETEKAIARGLEMADEGADIIDVGGESSRPGAEPVSLEEELRRVIPVIEGLSTKSTIPISIDTYKAHVAEKALECGAQVINDISGLRFDPKMPFVAAQYGYPVIMMHIRGVPKTMQVNPQYFNIMGEIIEYMREGIELFKKAGGDPQQVIIDPGIGFGKRLQDNLVILKQLRDLEVLQSPVMVGTSRKSFIGHVLQSDVQEREIGSLATVAVAVMNGAHIVRVHDTVSTRQVADMVDAVLTAEG